MSHDIGPLFALSRQILRYVIERLSVFVIGLRYHRITLAVFETLNVKQRSGFYQSVCLSVCPIFFSH